MNRASHLAALYRGDSGCSCLSGARLGRESRGHACCFFSRATGGVGWGGEWVQLPGEDGSLEVEEILEEGDQPDLLSDAWAFSAPHSPSPALSERLLGRPRHLQTMKVTSHFEPILTSWPWFCFLRCTGRAGSLNLLSGTIISIRWPHLTWSLHHSLLSLSDIDPPDTELQSWGLDPPGSNPLFETWPNPQRTFH